MTYLRDIGYRHNGTRNYMWAVFRCETCLSEIERMKHQGKSQESCPSCARKIQAEKVSSHKSRYTRLYRTWTNMKVRCNNPNDERYKHYGEKGIKVCEEWKSFSNFKLWALENGYTDSLTIDRKDVKGNYEPSNCQFITNEENAGKDNITIFRERYEEIVKDIESGISVYDSYSSRGHSRTAYYNAKKRYNKDKKCTNS